ncbi:MAG TPA: hypothetical protein VK506_11980 [Conexibacter sp.]|nr:hypothetical protein [Conexibacter sp.]
MPFVLTRINVEDYDAWRAKFELDQPNTRSRAEGHRLFRGVEDRNEVYVMVEYASAELARAARENLVGSGLLAEYPGHSEPAIIELAEQTAGTSSRA